MQTALTIVAIGVLAIIAYDDVHTRRIPNVLTLVIAILALFRMLLTGDATATATTVEAGAAVFLIAFLLFWRGILGGGDVKLLAAMVLLIGYQSLFSFLFLMSLCGGALALFILARDKLRSGFLRPSETASMPLSTEAGAAAPVESTVPYGVAIAAAGVVTLIV